MKTKKSAKLAKKTSKKQQPSSSIGPLVARLEAVPPKGRVAFLRSIGPKYVVQIATYYDLPTGEGTVARIVEHLKGHEPVATSVNDARDGAPAEVPAPTDATPPTGANVGEQGASVSPTGEPPATPTDGPARKRKKAATDGAPATPKQRDPRMPPVGTIIEKRDRHGAVRSTCQIVEGDKVLYNGTTYSSLSAAALVSSNDCGLKTKAVDGWAWWGLKTRPASPGSKNVVERLERAWEKYRERATAVAKSASGDDLTKVQDALRAQATALVEMATSTATAETA